MTLYVIGGGVAGLSAAVTGVAAGMAVCLIEAAPRAGGRCRSFDDPILGRRIDNGSHVLIGANPAALAYLEQIGARASLMRIGENGVPFVDLERGAHWTFRSGRPVPGAGIAAHLAALRLLFPAGGRTVGELLPDDILMRRFWEPLTVAALNTAPNRADAGLLRAILGEILRHGLAGLDLYMARDGLSESFVDPAVAWLTQRGARVELGRPVQAFRIEGARVAAIVLPDRELALEPGDRIVLATPPSATGGLLAEVTVPSGSNAIVNGHFRVEADLLPTAAVPVVGLCGATAQWLFRRADVLSVTVSDAAALLPLEQEAVAETLWRDVTRALGLPAMPVPPYRIVREKRATFDQTPDNQRLRPGPRTAWGNLLLAGDWTATGLPATIEGAIRSGRTAARQAART